MTPAPARYSDDVETLRPDEAETIHGLNKAFDTILTTVAEDDGRALHTKAHAILRGRLTVKDGLAPELAPQDSWEPGRAPVSGAVDA